MTGKDATTCFSRTENARCFPATPVCRRKCLTAFFVTARSIPWARPAAEVSPIRKKGSKTVLPVHFRTGEKTMMPSWPGFRNWQSWPGGMIMHNKSLLGGTTI